MLHALPGMGGDHRMYLHPWTTLPNFSAHDWMPFSGEKSIAAVAEAMVGACGIQEGDSLIGTSLGGMVALEIARLVRIEKLILIASALHPREISRTLATLHPLARIFPWRRLQHGARRIPVKSPQMYAANDPEFIRVMCRAVFEWPGIEKVPLPVFRLHGRFDPVISRPSHVDHWITGGHRINETHAKTCVDIIQGYLMGEKAGPAVRTADRDPIPCGDMPTVHPV